MQNALPPSGIFGSIPNVPIFTQWATRMDCYRSGVHMLPVAGIWGSKHHGAYSIAVSGFYEDDQDKGDIIIYTGTGGGLANTFAEQPTKDQSWEHPSNKALMVSSLTGNPVRVVRSWKCNSQYAPASGYRYDGLYKVTDCWMEKGQHGHDICRCRLERLPGQPAIPLRKNTKQKA